MKQLSHHGDVQIYLVDSIPTNAKRVKKQFIAASEKSGHVHALSGDYDIYEVDDSFIIDCHKDCIINHTLQKELAKNWDKPVELPKRDHFPGVLKKGRIYRIGIQNRFDPMENIKKRVID